jgi:hypothetical protein
VGIGIGNAGSYDALIDQVEPVRDVAAAAARSRCSEEEIVDLIAIVADPNFESIEGGGEEVANARI